MVKPGGDFLLILVANDRWAKLAFGPMLTHGGTRGREWWTGGLRDAGFAVVEEIISLLIDKTWIKPLAKAPMRSRGFVDCGGA